MEQKFIFKHNYFLLLVIFTSQNKSYIMIQESHKSQNAQQAKISPNLFYKKCPQRTLLKRLFYSEIVNSNLRLYFRKRANHRIFIKRTLHIVKSRIHTVGSWLRSILVSERIKRFVKIRLKYFFFSGLNSANFRISKIFKDFF